MLKKIKFVPYRSKKNGKHYWKMIAANGEKTAGGCEAFVKTISEKQFMRMKQIWASAVYSPEKKKSK
jgi:hypothetical protein